MEGTGPATLTITDLEQIKRIAQGAARAEIASLAGLVLRRTSEEHLSRSPDRNITDTQIRWMLAEIFGEALADFSRHTGDGEAPGA